MTSRFLIVSILAAVVCFGGGVLAGRIAGGESQSQESQSENADESDARKLTALGTRSGSGGTGQSSGFAAQARGLSRSSDFGIYDSVLGYFRLISQADASEIPALMEVFQREVHEEMGGEMLIRSLAKRWAKIDPEGAFHALMLGEPDGIREGQQEIIRSMTTSDPRAAWAAIVEADEKGEEIMANHERRGRLVGSVMGAIGQEDPQLFIELVGNLENKTDFRREIDSALGVIARTQPDAFLSQMDKLPMNLLTNRSEAFREAFGALGRDSVEEAIAWLDGLSGADLIHAESGIAIAWTNTDPAAALEWLDGQSIGARREAQAHVIQVLAREDPQAAADAVVALPSPGQRLSLAGNVAEAWVRQDRDATLQWVRSELEGQARGSAFGEMLNHEMNHANFEEDFDLLLEMADGSPNPNYGHEQFVRTWAGTDPRAAAGWAIERESRPERSLRHVIEEWVESDVEAARAYSNSLQDEELRETALSHIPSNTEPEGTQE